MENQKKKLKIIALNKIQTAKTERIKFKITQDILFGRVLIVSNTFFEIIYREKYLLRQTLSKTIFISDVNFLISLSVLLLLLLTSSILALVLSSFFKPFFFFFLFDRFFIFPKFICLKLNQRKFFDTQFSF